MIRILFVVGAFWRASNQRARFSRALFARVRARETIKIKEENIFEAKILKIKEGKKHD